MSVIAKARAKATATAADQRINENREAACAMINGTTTCQIDICISVRIC